VSVKTRAACTIVLRKQLASARVLAHSFKRCHSDSAFFILILDGPAEGDTSTDGIELLGLDNIDLDANDAHRLPMLHGPSELADLVRAPLLRTVRGSGARLAVYFSPEIEIFAPLPKLAEENSIVLGPEGSQEIADDPGCNVGYWNLPERTLSWAGDHYEVDGKPLRFFNFRGYDPDKPHLLSQDQGLTPRILLSEHLAVAKICDEYRGKLLREGYSELKGTPYRFDSLPSGLRIDDHMRRLYREAFAAFKNGSAPEPPSPFGPGGEKTFMEWLNEPMGKPGHTVTRYMLAIHAAREDVRNAFPDPAGADAAMFQKWYVLYGQAELNLPAVLTPLDAKRHSANGSGSPSSISVNIAGYFHAELGIGEAARLLVAGLEAAEIPFNTIAYEGTANRQTHRFVERKSQMGTADLNLICINADQMPAFAEKNNASLLHGRYSIGVWFWEVEDFPELFHGAFNYVDEIWVASEFMRKTLLRVSPKPVFKFHLPILAPKIDGSASRADLGLPDRFLFLFVFDLLSVLERKNPLGLIAAFIRAFAPDEGPVLVIKTINGDKRILEMEKMKYAARNRPDIILADGYLSESEKSTLLAQADCYVSLHRSEGYGLSIAEAMALGKPVVATAYSGNLEFMTPENSFLCPARRCEVGEGREPYPADSHWSEPDLVAAAKLLREVYTHPDEARARGRRAAEDMRALHSPEMAGRVLRARLETIRQRRSRSTPQVSPALLQDRVEALENENRALLQRLRENQSTTAHS
jgi:glycosyltransferase involved in cell wall biosynthesis